jgi:phage-related baseplate assembly protein
MSLPKPVFISEDSAQIVREMIADYEQRSGRIVQPADIERLLINMIAYREQLIRTSINDAARQNLVEFARFPMLDYLGQLVGVTRLGASAAVTTIRFTLIADHTGVTIPFGLRVASSDGKVVFGTLEERVIAPGTTVVDIDAQAQTAGTSGNGFGVGIISTILDPQPWLVSASNLTETTGGAAEESDDPLRDRIKLAPASFSNAGSKGAYEFYAKSASPAIIDVTITSSAPGDVDIYPLVEGGVETPQPILDAVLAACNAEDVRPLTDQVSAISPTRINYDIEVDVVKITGFTDVDVETAVTDALRELGETKLLRLGRDITLSEIIQAARVEGVYDVTVVDPVANIDIDETEFGFLGTITVNITGSTTG